MTPGMPNPAARSAMLSLATDQVLDVVSAYPLFSATKIAGRFHTDARFIASAVVPWLEAPSPKNATPTPPSPLSLAASAVPQISGGPPPTMPLAPSMPLDRSAMCMEPPLPRQDPVVLPKISAIIGLMSTPLAMQWPCPRWVEAMVSRSWCPAGGRELGVGLGCGLGLGLGWGRRGLSGDQCVSGGGLGKGGGN